MSFPAQGYVPNVLDTTIPLETVPTPQTIVAELLNVSVPIQTKFFTPDVTAQGIDPGQAVSFFITVAITGSPAKLQITLDGTNWLDINQGNTLSSGALFLFVIPVAESDLFNLRASKAITVNIARIGQFVKA